DAKKPKTRHMADLTSAGALDGAFWGMLLGWIFFMPFIGMAVGALTGALTGHFADYGIGRDFIENVRSKVTPGTSALFLLTGQVTVDKVAAAAKEANLHGELIQSNLSAAEEAKLKEAYVSGRCHDCASQRPCNESCLSSGSAPAPGLVVRDAPARNNNGGSPPWPLGSPSSFPPTRRRSIPCAARRSGRSSWASPWPW